MVVYCSRILSLLSFINTFGWMCNKFGLTKTLPKQCTHARTVTHCYHVVIMHTPSTMDPGKYMYQVMSAYLTD